jgi:hypothetical protein
MEGWIKLHRKFVEWRWFEKSEAVHLFIYLLLKANHKDNFWQDIEVKRGQLITSFGKISAETKISVQSVRTLLRKFEDSQELTSKSTNKFTLLTICNYECYQGKDEDTNIQTNNQLTNNQQTTNKQLTTNKNDKNEKNENNIPNWVDFLAYAQSKKPNVDKDELLLKYESWMENDWCTNSKGKQHKIKNWRSTLLNTLPYINVRILSEDEIRYNHVMNNL